VRGKSHQFGWGGGEDDNAHGAAAGVTDKKGGQGVGKTRWRSEGRNRRLKPKKRGEGKINGGKQSATRKGNTRKSQPWWKKKKKMGQTKRGKKRGAGVQYTKKGVWVSWETCNNCKEVVEYLGGARSRRKKNNRIRVGTGDPRAVGKRKPDIRPERMVRWARGAGHNERLVDRGGGEKKRYQGTKGGGSVREKTGHKQPKQRKKKDEACVKKVVGEKRGYRACKLNQITHKGVSQKKAITRHPIEGINY